MHGVQLVWLTYVGNLLIASEVETIAIWKLPVLLCRWGEFGMWYIPGSHVAGYCHKAYMSLIARIIVALFCRCSLFR